MKQRFYMNCSEVSVLGLEERCKDWLFIRIIYACLTGGKLRDRLRSSRRIEVEHGAGNLVLRTRKRVASRQDPNRPSDGLLVSRTPSVPDLEGELFQHRDRDFAGTTNICLGLGFRLPVSLAFDR